MRLTDRGSQLREAVERVESRESDGLVVARLRNLGSSLEEAVAVLERIRAAGGAFVSVCDGIDLSGSHGCLVMRLLLSVLDRDDPRRKHERTHPVAAGASVDWVVGIGTATGLALLGTGAAATLRSRRPVAGSARTRAVS